MTMDFQLPRPISRIVFRCSEQTKTALGSKMQIHEGSMLTDELLQQARETAKGYNPDNAQAGQNTRVVSSLPRSTRDRQRDKHVAVHTLERDAS